MLQPQSRHRILVVDDEPEILKLIGELLSEFYDVVLAKNGNEAIAKATKQLPSVIVLDIRMPERDGIQTCQMLRANPETRRIPILMLTAATDANERTRAFIAGADDFISKPVLADELLARVGSKIRRLDEAGGGPARILQCGNLQMNLPSLEVRIDDREVTLTLLEFDLLRFIIDNKGKLCGRQEIMMAVWQEPGSEQKGRLLDPHILSLRKKLDGFDHVLSTVYGGGYILKTAVTAPTHEVRDPA